MKKLIYCALALAAGLFATSCQQENLEPVAGGDTVTFKVSLPEVATKAFDDGREVIDDLVYAVYRTTATTEAAAFADYENYQLVYQVNPVQQTGFTNGLTTVELELINDQNYVILFWAQNFSADVYNTTDLRNVSYAAEKFNALKANEGAYAAFSGRAFIEKVKGTSVQSVTLYRPFAQINIGTADPEKYDVQVLKTAVSVSRAGAGFNVADQTALESATTPYVVEFEAAAMPEGEKLTVGTTEYHSCVDNEGKSEGDKQDHYVAMNYIFAKETVAVTYAIETTFGTVTNTIDNVPVKTNYRTNIIGNLLTSDVKYDVTLDKEWGTPDKNVEVISVASADEIVEAIKNASADKETNIKLEENIDLGTLSQLVNTKSSAQPTGNSVIVIPENRSIVVDLNGCTLNAPYRQNSTTNHYYAFENYGTLTIVDSKGNGAINSRGNFNYGTMILESGTIDAIDGNGGYGVRNYEGAEFVMNGGAIVTSLEDDNLVDDGGYDATTLRVDEGATATINAGTINNICDFTYAIDNEGTVVINGGEIKSVHSTVSSYGNLTVNGGSFTCNGIEGITAHALVAWDGSETTINGGSFNGKDNYNGFNVDAGNGAVVNITGGKFLPVHSGSLYGEGTINVRGGEFFDDPSKRVADDYVAVKDETANVYNVVKAYAKVGETKYPSLNAAFTAAEDEATIVVLRDTEMTATEVPAGKALTLDLNGKTVTGVDATSKNFGLISLSKQSVLTVKNGTMKVSATINSGWNRYSAVLANNQGTLNVENCTIEHLGGTDMAYGIDNLTNSNIGDAYLYVNSESIIKSTYIGIRQFLNCSKKMNSLVVENATVTGGRLGIWMQEPHADPGVGKLVVTETANVSSVRLSGKTSYASLPVEMSVAASAVVTGVVEATDLPEGYTVENVNGTWKVLAWTVAEDAASLAAACAEGKNVVLANDLTITPEEMTTAPYGNKMALSQNGGVFNGNGKNISVTANGDNYVVMTNGGTIKNLDIDRGFRGIVLMYPNQDVYVDNVNIGVDDEVCYTINTAEGEGTNSLHVSNSNLYGWCSIGTAVKDVTFTNCTFGQGTYYTDVYGRLVKPYVDAIFDSCDFCDRCYIDLSAFDGKKVTVKNCTVNGVKITAENWTSLVAPESTCSEGQISVELKNGTFLTAENRADYIVFE